MEVRNWVDFAKNAFFRVNIFSIAGWMPTRRLIDVVLGLDSLFTDLIDFDDALNAQAAQQWSANKVVLLAIFLNYAVLKFFKMFFLALVKPVCKFGKFLIRLCNTTSFRSHNERKGTLPIFTPLQRLSFFTSVSYMGLASFF